MSLAGMLAPPIVGDSARARANDTGTCVFRFGATLPPPPADTIEANGASARPAGRGFKLSHGLTTIFCAVRAVLEYVWRCLGVCWGGQVMFTKKAEHEMGAPVQPSIKSAPGNSATSKMARSVIGQDLVFTGDISDTGEIEFLGKLEGDVQCSSILIGDKAQIVGTVTAEDVVVQGRVVGLIRGLRVTLEGQAHVEGEIHYQSMAMAHGVHFDGRGRRLDGPLMAGAAPADDATPPADTARLELLSRQRTRAAE